MIPATSEPAHERLPLIPSFSRTGEEGARGAVEGVFEPFKVRRSMLNVRRWMFSAGFVIAVLSATQLFAQTNRLPRYVEPGPYQATWESLAKNYECPDWFRDAKFGIWAHWSAQCVPE